eukprot:m.226272 g.226272  ORF g.226272 m.226272 type:complete len:272 (-) comp16911_c0_seq1:156-971(-)
MLGLSDDALYFGATIEAVHAATFVVCTLFFLYIESQPAFDKYRIRPKAPLDPKLRNQAILNIATSHLVAVPYLAILVYPLFRWRGMDLHAALPGPLTCIWQIIFSMMVEDTLFYWIHRLLHHPKLYKHLHKQHHKFINTVSYAAEYASPIEQTISNVFPTYCGPFLCKMNLHLFWVWTFLRLWETFEGHSGFVLPYSPWQALLSVQGGAARHDFHHSHNAGSFGSLFKFWDWAMGTDAQFKAFVREQEASKQGKGAAPAATVTEEEQDKSQ